MTRETKAGPQFTKEITDRLATGIFMVHGNIDDGQDRSHPGALADYKVDGRDRTRFLWAHDASQPPVAVIKSIRELSRAELPPAVLSYAPDATGGAEVVREYLDTPRGNEVLAGLKAGAIQEMSYAYEISSYSFTEDDDSGKTIRELTGLKLFDISDVNHGMNNSTLAAKGVDWKAQPFAAHSDAVEAAIAAYVERATELKDRRAKEGRTLSAENVRRLQECMDQLESAMMAMRDMVDMAVPDSGKQSNAEARRLLLAFERTRAQLNGVHIL